MDGHIVGQSINLGNPGSLGQLTFPLDADGSVTTDGTLLSSLGTDTINDDISSTTILRVLPQTAEATFSRGTYFLQLSYTKKFPLF